MSIASLADEQAYLYRQFRGVLIVVTSVVVIGSSADTVSFLTNPESESYDDLFINMFLAGGVSVMWWFFRQQHIGRASIVGSLACLVAVLYGVSQAVAPANWFYITLLTILSPVFALPYVQSTTFRWLGVVVAAVGLAIIAQAAIWMVQNNITSRLVSNYTLVASLVLLVVLFLLWQFSNLHHLLISSLRGGNTELLELKAGLEQQVTERTAELETTLAELETTLANLQTQNEVQQRLLTEIQSQQRLIHVLSVPVLPISPTVLVLPLIGTLDPARLDLIRQHALEAIEQSRSRVLVLDVTGVPEVDTQAAQGLLRVAQATRVMGSQCVLAGMRPELAQALVRLGVDLGSLRTYATLQRALDVVR
ncbi:MAG: STAS domain-containing protein [Chloroflexaceae bacterium]|nr:STAS domain-containing protein [Chloroflexaceae bacterium]